MCELLYENGEVEVLRVWRCRKVKRLCTDLDNFLWTTTVNGLPTHNFICQNLVDDNYDDVHGLPTNRIW